MDDRTLPPVQGELFPGQKLCECGCGNLASIATRTNYRFGHVRGESVRFVRGHQGRVWRIDADGRRCAECGAYKAWSEYYVHAKGPRGRNSVCRDCLHVRYRGRNSWRPEQVVYVVDDLGRECTSCRAYKPWDEYGVHKNSTRGHYGRCRDCARDERRAWAAANPERRARLKLRSQAVALGLDPDMIEAHFQAHSGLCDICGRSAAEAGARKRLSIDHDHASGAFRGLLCSPCNSGLGQLRDDQKVLTAAIDYLIRAADERGHR